MTPTLVFDLDGTLADTAADMASAYNAAVGIECRRMLSTKEAIALIGDGIETFFSRALTATGLDVSGGEREGFRDSFMKSYAEAPARLARLYPGMRQLLMELRCCKVNTAVCSNKAEPIAKDILQKLDVLHLFDAVVGHRPGAVKKPDPAPLYEAIRIAGGQTNKALLIGDSEADLGAAKAAGIPCILVSYGYSAHPVYKLGATRCVDNVGELNTIIKKYLATGSLGQTTQILTL